MILFACSHCGQKLKATDEQVGKKAKCPKCHQLSPIPQPAAPRGSEAPAVAPPPTPDAPPSEAATVAPGGTQPEIAVSTATIEIPGYEILGELGRGGMGVIYKARQLSPRRLVALKMILAGEHAGSEALARFQREADAVARLSHTNIVRIHEVKEHQGRPFLTLEFVEGGNLAERLRDKPLDFRAAAELLRPLARAVQFAHRRGILHRDLKPANVLLASDGTPKITDFGLAKQLDGTASVAAAAARTQSGAIMGTPAYMAPEQAGGKSKDIGPAADVYALGAILYECLTGRPPFQGNTTIDLLVQVVGAEPPTPRSLRADCPRELEIICLKCLQKNPAQRYASAGALADDLRRWLDGEPIHARPPGRLRRLSRAVRRRKELVAAAGGVVAGLVALVALSFFIVSETTTEVKPPKIAGSEEQTPSESRFEIARRRRNSANNLTQLALAMHNINSTYGYMPPAAITHPVTRQPLLSWCVAVLPFIEQVELYQQFKLDEAWDSPHNRPLLAKMPKMFEIEGVKTPQPNCTYYQAFVGPGTAFEPRFVQRGPYGFAGLRVPADFPDGSSNTLLFVEAGEAVPWSQPIDLPYNPRGPLPKLGGPFTDGFNVALADGSVRFLNKTISEQTLRNAITRNDGQPLGDDWKQEVPLPVKTAEQAAREQAAANLKQTGLLGTVQVSGKVAYKGAPLTGVVLTFLAPDRSTIDVQVAADGTYGTAQLKPGIYKISVSARTGFDPRYPRKYANPETSGLHYEVKRGRQTYDILLVN